MPGSKTKGDPLTQSVLDTSVLGRVQAGQTQHTLLFGLEWSEQKGKARRFIGAAPDIDLYLPLYGVISVFVHFVALFSQGNRSSTKMHENQDHP